MEREAMTTLQRLGILLVLVGAGAILYEIFAPDISSNSEFGQTLLRYAIGALILGAVLIKFFGKRTSGQESGDHPPGDDTEDK